MTEPSFSCGIYKITSPTNSVYVGQSTNMSKRWRDYRQGRCPQQRKLYNSIIKYGWVNHVFETLEECERDELDCRERYWQDFYEVKDREKGLNCVLTGCGDLKEEKIKVSKPPKPKGVGSKKSYWKKGIENPNFDRKLTEFERFKMSVGKRKLNGSEKQSLLDNFKEGDWDNRAVKAIPKDNKNSKGGKGANKRKTVLDTQTGVFYYSVREVSDLYGFKYENFKSKLNGKNRNTTQFIYA